jgi:hypothetical protein
VDQWDVIPKYAPERYRDHYFYTDFENLRRKFLEPEAQAAQADPTSADKLSSKATESAGEVDHNDVTPGNEEE